MTDSCLTKTNCVTGTHRKGENINAATSVIICGNTEKTIPIINRESQIKDYYGDRRGSFVLSSSRAGDVRSVDITEILQHCPSITQKEKIFIGKQNEISFVGTKNDS